MNVYFPVQVDCMEEALERSQGEDAPELKVDFLLDYTRGSRGLSLSHTGYVHSRIQHLKGFLKKKRFSF